MMWTSSAPSQSWQQLLVLYHFGLKMFIYFGVRENSRVIVHSLNSHSGQGLAGEELNMGTQPSLPTLVSVSNSSYLNILQAAFLAGSGPGWSQEPRAPVRFLT